MNVIRENNTPALLFLPALLTARIQGACSLAAGPVVSRNRNYRHRPPKPASMVKAERSWGWAAMSQHVAVTRVPVI